MDHRSKNGNGGAVTILPPTTTIIGAGLAHRHLDARQKAVLVASILAGETTFSPSMKQLASCFNVSATYIAIAQKLSPGKRAAILRGLDPVSFAELMNPPRQLSLRGPELPTLTLESATESQLWAALEKIAV
jgi:hypothetical protein